MKRDEILEGLTELLETDAPLEGPELLADLGSWDSVAVISFMAMVDDRWSVTLTPNDIYACKTVDELVALVG